MRSRAILTRSSCFHIFYIMYFLQLKSHYLSLVRSRSRSKVTAPAPVGRKRAGSVTLLPGYGTYLTKKEMVIFTYLLSFIHKILKNVPRYLKASMFQIQDPNKIHKYRVGIQKTAKCGSLRTLDSKN